MTTKCVARRWIWILLALLMATAAACSGDDAPSDAAPDTLVPTRQPPELAAACSDYEGAFANWADAPGTADDDRRFADALDAIASTSASRTALEGPIREVATEFRAGQMNIDSGAITDLCAGNQPVEPSGEQTRDRAAYVARVHAEAPELRDIADDDLIAAADQVCTAMGTDPTLNAETDMQRYLILTGIANTAMGHDDEADTEPAVRVAADVLCPEHAATVTAILAAG
jgi:hypothetical protein